MKNFGYVMATKMLVDNKRKVCLMFREDPANEQDSGWRFFCGDERDSDDNMTICDIDAIIAIDKSILPYLSSKKGATYIREGEDEIFTMAKDTMETGIIAKKISKEIGCDMSVARRMEEQLAKVHEALHPVVKAWLTNDMIGFEFKGVSLGSIMEKEHVKYIQAIFSMNTLLNDPQMADVYGDFEFDTDFLED